jgi:hypothetical protein
MAANLSTPFLVTSESHGLEPPSVTLDTRPVATLGEALLAAGNGSIIQLSGGEFLHSPALLTGAKRVDLQIRGNRLGGASILPDLRIYARNKDGATPNRTSIRDITFRYTNSGSGYILSPSIGSILYNPATPTLSDFSLVNVSLEGIHTGNIGTSGTYMDLSGAKNILFDGLQASLTGQHGFNPVTGIGGGFLLFVESGENIQIVNSIFKETGYSSSLILLFMPDAKVDGNIFIGGGLVRQDTLDPAGNPRGERFYNAGGSLTRNHLTGGAFFDFLFMEADQGTVWHDYKIRHATADGTYGLRTEVSNNTFEIIPSGEGVLIRSDADAARVQSMLSIFNNHFHHGVAVRSGISEPHHLVFGANTINGIRFDHLHVGGTADDTIDVSFTSGTANWISGGPGNDVLTGAIAASDAFVFWAPLDSSSNVDRINTFTTDAGNIDQIWLDRYQFPALFSNDGLLDPGSFTLSTSDLAQGSSSQVIYNLSSGQLSYDRDGDGPGLALAFAILNQKPTLTSSEIRLFGGDVPQENIPAGGTELLATPDGRTIRFDPLQYIASYPDLIRAFGADAAAGSWHYINWGFNEGRRIDSFDPAQYLAGHDALITRFGSDTAAATRQYISEGFAAGTPADAFDEFRYLASNPDLITSYRSRPADAAEHYLSTGRFNGSSRTAFDPLQYIASYPDLIRAFGADAAAGSWHYVLWGSGEGRMADRFDEASYLAAHPELQTTIGADPSALAAHFIASSASAFA